MGDLVVPDFQRKGRSTIVVGDASDVGELSDGETRIERFFRRIPQLIGFELFPRDAESKTLAGILTTYGPWDDLRLARVTKNLRLLSGRHGTITGLHRLPIVSESEAINRLVAEAMRTYDRCAGGPDPVNDQRMRRQRIVVAFLDS